MTLTSHNEVGPSLQALPATVVFSPHLLLTQKASVTVNSGSMDEKVNRIELRAVRMTSTLEHIQGYSHGGINE
jgi:hypothetical protein